MVVVAIIGLMAAMTVTAMTRGKKRADLASAGGELAALFQRAKSEAASRGHPVVLLLLPGAAPDDCRGSAGDANCLRYFLIDNDPRSGRFDSAALAAFNPAAPPAASSASGAGDRLIELGAFGGSVQIGLADGDRAAPLPPFNVLPVPSSAGAGGVATSACSFCINGGRGMVTFSPGGEATFSAGAASGGAVFLTTGKRGESVGVGVIGPTGLITQRLGIQ